MGLMSKAQLCHQLGSQVQLGNQNNKIPFFPLRSVPDDLQFRGGVCFLQDIFHAAHHHIVQQVFPTVVAL
jgi:hypothetical protein